ncbi:MAG: IS1595 family transposase [Acidobacteriaceae bacterium]|nr:IS1595 family transposase [Acidobacteriaceae bacterium]
MTSEDFAAWLSAISGMSDSQRAEAKAALEKATGAGSEATKAGRRNRREDALGTSGVERVAAQGCPHCAGHEIVGWGRSDGLLRYRCKSCGRTFNALTKTPMAHLRKKEKWLDHARAMIEGKSLAKTAAQCGVHPTTAFRWRHRFLRAPSVNKPRTLRGIVEADETFILESFKGRRSDLPRAARKRGGKARHPGAYQDSIPVLVARDRKGSTFDAVLPQVTSAAIGAALAGIVTPVNHLVGDGGLPICGFARRAGIPFHAVPSPGKPSPEAPHLHINNVNAYHSRLKQWLNRFNGVATKNLPNYLGWRRALEAWGDNAQPLNWVNGAIGNGPYQQVTL